MLFDDGVRIDFQVTTVATLGPKPHGDRAASTDRYRVLVDKDGIASRIVHNGPPADEILLPAVAEALAYGYPHGTAHNVVGYIRRVEQGCD